MCDIDTEESSASSEENIDLFKEAANCDYVNKLYRNEFNIQNDDISSKRKKLDHDSELDTITSHERFLAKRLKKSLDHLIKLIDHPVSSQKINMSSSKGIRLLKDSIYIDDIEETIQTTSFRPKQNTLSEKEYSARAKEAAVTFDWVMSKTNTQLWCNHKKPKIINLKMSKKLSGEKIECDIVSAVNIPDKFCLI